MFSQRSALTMTGSVTTRVRCTGVDGRGHSTQVSLCASLHRVLSAAQHTYAEQRRDALLLHARRLRIRPQHCHYRLERPRLRRLRAGAAASLPPHMLHSA